MALETAQDPSLVELKAAMLCYGVAADDNVKAALAESYELQAGFIHGTVFLLDHTDPVNTGFVDGVELGRAPVLTIDAGVPVVTWSGRQAPCPPLHTLQVNDQEVDGDRLGDYFTLHSPQTLFAAPLRQCIFISIGQPCTFCTFEGGKLHRLSRVTYQSLLERILEVEPGLTAVAIGGGTPNLTDHGARYYAELAEITKSYGLAVSVEMVPPNDLGDLRLLYDAPVDSLIMSIELWDDARRKEVCLGKGRLSKAHYRAAWEDALHQLGAERVSSVLLGGIESTQKTIEGIDGLIEQGVIPTILPYRNYDRSSLSGSTSMEIADYLRVSSYCAAMLEDRGLDPRHQPGCTACGGCSIEAVTARLLRGGVELDWK